MSSPRRIFQRALVAKLSDARERLHALGRAAEERSNRADARCVCPRDINGAAIDAEVPRG